MIESLAGRLLVATPFLLDPNFYRTVVLMIEHDDDGSLGVVLNRPLEIPVSDYLDEWESLVAEPRVVFSGGPVRQEVALAVARGPQSAGDLSALIIHDVQLVDLDHDPAEAGFETVRVFSGYAAWAPGQLEGEIRDEAWWVFASTPEDPFSSDAENLWPLVLKRQRGKVALFATLPDDPGLN
ncbi:MAG: YqgE/AlgH family protein [Acidimicrobiia bacterium]|nr:YqgE/AlgH family protein [Acidimicrobiia bacterium]